MTDHSQTTPFMRDLQVERHERAEFRLKRCSSLFLPSFSLAILLGWCSFGQNNFGLALLAVFSGLMGLLPLRITPTIVLVLASTTLSFALAELSLGFFKNEAVEIETYSPESDVTKAGYWSKSDLGYQPLPGRYTSKKLTPEGQTIYDVVYSIGEQGFRITPGNDIPVQRRINFFGCSFMFGEGLNDNETIPFFIHNMDPSIAVRNFGWHGYGVHQALRIMESDRDTSGDINFLLTAPWHAERSACLADYSAGSPRYQLISDGEIILSGTCDTGLHQETPLHRIVNHSNILQLVRLTLNQNQDRQIDLYLAIISRIKRLSEARNQRFIVGFIRADRRWFVGSYSNDKIMTKLSAMGVDVIDVTLAPLSENASRELYIHPLDKHPSSKANEARAKLIRDYLMFRVSRS